MIVFDLKCGKSHVFEAWFRDNATFESQCKDRKIECPVCGGKKIEKAPMAPNIAVSNTTRGAKSEKSEKSEKSVEETVAAAKFLSTCRALREEVEKNSDYVGPEFAEEARRIHYGESDKRSIYGEASDRDARELHEEGVPIAAIPWLPRTDS